MSHGGRLGLLGLILESVTQSLGDILMFFKWQLPVRWGISQSLWLRPCSIRFGELLSKGRPQDQLDLAPAFPRSSTTVSEASLTCPLRETEQCASTRPWDWTGKESTGQVPKHHFLHASAGHLRRLWVEPAMAAMSRCKSLGRPDFWLGAAIPHVCGSGRLLCDSNPTLSSSCLLFRFSPWCFLWVVVAITIAIAAAVCCPSSTSEAPPPGNYTPRKDEWIWMNLCFVDDLFDLVSMCS